jgi:crotonobetainyl-CoA:carnitine CoA-transferase CaiB-like acyl-CoA transferase
VIVDGVFAFRPRDTWGEACDREGIIWARVQTVDEVIADPRARLAGAFVDVPDGDDGTILMVNSPVSFSETEARPAHRGHPARTGL